MSHFTLFHISWSEEIRVFHSSLQWGIWNCDKSPQKILERFKPQLHRLVRPIFCRASLHMHLGLPRFGQRFASSCVTSWLGPLGFQVRDISTSTTKQNTISSPCPKKSNILWFHGSSQKSILQSSADSKVRLYCLPLFKHHFVYVFLELFGEHLRTQSEGRSLPITILLFQHQNVCCFCGNRSQPTKRCLTGHHRPLFALAGPY